MVEKGHYVTRWKGIGNGRELFEMSHGFIMTTSKLGLFYLKTQNRDYLYNTKLELVDDEDELGKSRLLYVQS